MERIVEVTMRVRVKTDDAKFTQEWMAEYRQHFSPFFTVDDHAEHIAQLEAREVLDPKFTEGYGPLAEMGIAAEVMETTMDVVERAERQVA